VASTMWGTAFYSTQLVTYIPGCGHSIACCYRQTNTSDQR
jgi:hypothetical protein